MKRFFSLFLNIGPSGGRWQILEPFSTKMSPRSSPGPGGWWLPVVRFSLMHRLLSKHFNPVVSYSMATSERTHCAVAHSYGVLSPPAHSTLAPPHHRGLGRGRGPVTDLDVWSQNPAGNSWWGQCFTSPSRPPYLDFPSGSPDKEHHHVHLNGGIESFASRIYECDGTLMNHDPLEAEWTYFWPLLFYSLGDTRNIILKLQKGIKIK